MKTPNVAARTDARNEDVRPKPDQSVLEKRLDEMVALGLATRGPKWGEPFPEDFFTKRLPKADKSVLEALLEDRDDER